MELWRKKRELHALHSKTTKPLIQKWEHDHHDDLPKQAKKDRTRIYF